jgi:hypothetical protein
MLIELTSQQLQRLVDQAFKDLKHYAEDPNALPRDYYSGLIDSDLECASRADRVLPGRVRLWPICSPDCPGSPRPIPQLLDLGLHWFLGRLL